MKRILSLAIALLVVCSCFISVSAARANVIYDGESKNFIFKPGSEYSPTDLFSDFKDVMPGDSITQEISVKNDASNEVKVKIYMRSLGAFVDSKEFLSQLNLRVEKTENNDMPYMFDAAASETAQLSDWVELGTLYSGGEVNLNVILDVPKELDNQYKQNVGYIDWEFKVEEFPIEKDDPKPPQTGDDSNIYIWIALIAISLIGILVFLLLRRRKKEN